MSSDSISNGAGSNSETDTLDFSRRADLAEQMDEPCSYQELRDCLRELAQVNRITFTYRPTLKWLQQFARVARRKRPLHIVDVGSGGGDMLRRIERWATRNTISVKLTGVDLNPHAVRAAREFTPPDSKIRWITGRAQSIDDTSDSVDIVISSLFTHHLGNDEIVQFLRWMESTAQSGWFINDLCRSREAYWEFTALATIFRWHPFIRHDGPVSIRRAFLPHDWMQYMGAAGLLPQTVSIAKHWPARLCVSRIKTL